MVTVSHHYKEGMSLKSA